MAVRPVFVANSNYRLCDREMVDFTYFNGFSKAQKQRCIESLQNSFKKDYPDFEVLEISRYSECELGQKLSAFNLQICLEDGKKVSVECAFQAGKVFEKGGPYLDLLEGTSKDAKRDPRLKNSGKVVGFVFENEKFPVVPRTFFYNWLYINALNENPDLAEQILEYDAFTDIVFNPEKSLNCQAEAAAYFVALKRLGLLEEALKSKEDFVNIVYKQNINKKLLEYKVERKKAILETNKKSDTEEVSKESQILQKEQEVYTSRFETGQEIVHPRFGQGQITGIENRQKSTILTVEFCSGVKKLDEVWLLSQKPYKK